MAKEGKDPGLKGGKRSHSIALPAWMHPDTSKSENVTSKAKLALQGAGLGDVGGGNG